MARPMQLVPHQSRDLTCNQDTRGVIRMHSVVTQDVTLEGKTSSTQNHILELKQCILLYYPE